MKKFLKVLLIIILVCASVGCTAYLFYKQLNPKVDYFNELSSYYSNSSSQKFGKNLNEVLTNTESVGDTRFSLIVETNNKLNNCLESLSSYFIVADNYKINEKQISKGLSNLKSARSHAETIMNAYLTKITAQGELSVGANPTYVACADYLVEYANFINLINNELNALKINRTLDIKFSIIEVYCNVCINTFGDVTTDYKPVINDGTNLNRIKDAIKFKNLYLDLGENTFSYINNSFIKFYNLCNKAEFAKNLDNNITNGKSNSETNELRAGYYLNLILGD